MFIIGHSSCFVTVVANPCFMLLECIREQRFVHRKETFRVAVSLRETDIFGGNMVPGLKTRREAQLCYGFIVIFASALLLIRSSALGVSGSRKRDVIMLRGSYLPDAIRFITLGQTPSPACPWLP